MKFLFAVLCVFSLKSFSADYQTHTSFSNFVQLKNGHNIFVKYIPAQKNQPTLVFVNGLTFSTTDYAIVSQILIDSGYGVFLYDAYGMGRTLLNNPIPNAPIKVDSQVADLDELLSNFKISAPYNLVGLSYGGGILTAYATRHPEKVKTLMMMSPYTEVIEDSKKIILGQIAATRLYFPTNKATDEELANYYIRQFVYQTYPIYEPAVLENPFKLEGISALVQGITPYRPIDEVAKLPKASVHLMVGTKDEYVTKNVYDSFWQKIPAAKKCSYVAVEETKHKISSLYPYFTARWINYIMQNQKSSCTGLEYSADALMFTLKSKNNSFVLPDLK